MQDSRNISLSLLPAESLYVYPYILIISLCVYYNIIARRDLASQISSFLYPSISLSISEGKAQLGGFRDGLNWVVQGG